MHFGKFRILGKLALLVLVPLLGVVALSVPIVVDRIAVANDAQRVSDTVRLAARAGTAIQELQEERLLSVGFLFGLVEQRELALQSARSAEAIAEVGSDGRELPPGLRNALRDADRLENTRQNVLQQAIRPDQIVTEFTTVVTPIITGIGLTGAADLTTSVGKQVFALEQALRTDDLISQASGYLTAATITKNAALASLFSATLIQLQQLIGNAETYFTSAQFDLYSAAQEAFGARVGTEFLVQAAIDPNAAIRSLDISTLYPSLRSVLVLGDFVAKRVVSDVDVIVTDSRDDALRDAFLIGGGSLLFLLLVVGLSGLMARAVARPLRRLTGSADRIARAAEAELERVADDDAEAARPIRLDPVDVAAQDEIGDLARAFDRVQATAVRLVERQVLGRRHVAQMFAHVGRRTQNLVGRQLALIDSLERRETDNERLGQLYRLDHLSSRLRRNASSLVVLSGGAGANEHMAPLKLTDVMRLALAEIEDYTRVEVDVPEEIMVVPAVLADLTLLLAELMENATSFSPPHTRVTVSMTESPSGIRLAIADQGLGMPAERLAEENARLTRRERLDLAPTEVLGLFVVGRIARRHGIAVSLAETIGGGVTARVDLTSAHLVSRTSRGARPGEPLFASAFQTSDIAQVLAAAAARSTVPGSQQPFDPAVVARAARTLEGGRTWDAFTPAPSAGLAPRPAPSLALSAAPGSVLSPDPGSVLSPDPGLALSPASSPAPSRPVIEAGPALQEPIRVQPVYDPGAPVAGRLPVAMPELPAAGPTAWTQPAGPAPQPTWSNEPLIPAQPDESSYWDEPAGSTGPDRPAASAGPALVRRVPGASLPPESPRTPPPPVTAPSALDPDAVRAQMEQFEYGVALALNETQSKPEGHPQ